MDIQNILAPYGVSSVYDLDVHSLNELLYKALTNDKILFDYIVNELSKKTDLYGDHKGSWQGLNKPTLSEEGAHAQVEKNMNDIININAFLESNKKLRQERFVYVEDFGAKGDYDMITNSGTDDTISIQNTIDFAFDNKISNVMFGSKGYLIKGMLNVKSGITLIGTRESFTQSLSTHVENGYDRAKIVSETTLKFAPTCIDVTPLLFDNQTGLKNVTILYDQVWHLENESNIVKYATTIKAKHGFCCDNICVKGAYSFIEVEGESARISRIYGWTFGNGITIKRSDDVSFITEIHLNPNVVRPTPSVLELSKSREESVALTIIDCDGVMIDNFFALGYRTGIKLVGNSNVGTALINVNNFFFDWIGVAFDFDIDSNFVQNITNGTVIYGFTDKSSHGGLLKLNKTINEFIQPINIENVCCSRLTYHFVNGIDKIDQLITFDYEYGYELNINNLYYDKFCKFSNQHGCKIVGDIKGGGYFVDISTEKRNILKNEKLTEFTGETPTGFSKSVANEFTTVTTWLDDDGYCNISNSDNLEHWHGLTTRLEIVEKADFCVYLKFKKWNVSRTKVFIKVWDKDYANPREIVLDVDDNGVVMHRTTSGNILDVSFIPSYGVSGNAIIDFIKVTRWSF